MEKGDGLSCQKCGKASARVVLAANDGLCVTCFREVTRPWSISALGFAASANQLYAATARDRICLYDTANGEVLREFVCQSEPIAASLSPAESLLAVGDDRGRITLFDFRTGRREHVFQPHDNWVWSVVFSPDGATLYSAGRDGVVGVLDFESGLLRRRHLLDDEINGIDVSPAGGLIVSASDDGAVRVWDLDFRLVRILRPHRGNAIRARFFHGGRRIVSTDAEGNVSGWDAANGRLIWRDTLPRTTAISGGPAFALDATPDDVFVVAGGRTDGVVDIRNGLMGQVLARFWSSDALSSVALHSPTGWVAAAGDSGAVTLWRIGQADSMRVLVEPHESPVDLDGGPIARSDGWYDAIAANNFGRIPAHHDYGVWTRDPNSDGIDQVKQLHVHSHPRVPPMSVEVADGTTPRELIERFLSEHGLPGLGSTPAGIGLNLEGRYMPLDEPMLFAGVPDEGRAWIVGLPAAQPTALITAPLDAVRFLVTTPEAVSARSTFVLDVWAHLEEQRSEVLEMARDEAGGPSVRKRSKGPIRVSRGTVLTVRLRIAGLIVETPEDTILWTGQVGNASFVVVVPSETQIGEYAGVASVHANGLEVLRIHFTVMVGQRDATAGNPVDRTDGRTSIQKAFASYSSADRDEVLSRVQGIQKILPDLDIFLDVASLRSGQDWEAELTRVIPENDVFYLFWSESASHSRWVEMEWRAALAARGMDFIDPVPLDPPDVAPPPEELASKHFSDWTLAYRRGRRRPVHRGARTIVEAVCEVCEGQCPGLRVSLSGGRVIGESCFERLVTLGKWGPESDGEFTCACCTRPVQTAYLEFITGHVCQACASQALKSIAQHGPFLDGTPDAIRRSMASTASPMERIALLAALPGVLGSPASKDEETRREIRAWVVRQLAYDSADFISRSVRQLAASACIEAGESVLESLMADDRFDEHPLHFYQNVLLVAGHVAPEHPDVKRLLLEAADDERASVRTSWIHSVRNHPADWVLERVEAARSDPDSVVRQVAQETMAGWGATEGAGFEREPH